MAKITSSQVFTGKMSLKLKSNRIIGIEVYMNSIVNGKNAVLDMVFVHVLPILLSNCTSNSSVTSEKE